MKLKALLFFCAFSISAMTCRAAELPQSPTLGSGFGVQIKEWWANSEDLDDIKDMGIQYLRFGFVWHVTEKARGIYDWASADYFMKMLKKRNLYVVYEIGGTNGDYSPMVDALPNDPLGQGQMMSAAPTSPKALAALDQYITETVRRYHNDHIIWEIWNEPDMNSNWPPKVNAKDFAYVISNICATVKQVDPSAVVIGPALAFLPARNNNGHINFLATILKSPAGACLDAISIHPYRHRDQLPESVIEDYVDIRKYIVHNTLPGNKILPIINSEWGYSTSEVTEEQQAAYILRSFLVNRMNGIPLSIWYEYRDSLADDQTDVDKMEREAHFGMRDFETNEEKLSARVVGDVLPHLLDAHIEKRVDLGDSKIYALRLKNDNGQNHMLFWLADSKVRNPEGLSITTHGESITYPIGIIPTLVCLDKDAQAEIVPGKADEDQRYYVPCAYPQ